MIRGHERNQKHGRGAERDAYGEDVVEVKFPSWASRDWQSRSNSQPRGLLTLSLLSELKWVQV